MCLEETFFFTFPDLKFILKIIYKFIYLITGNYEIMKLMRHNINAEHFFGTFFFFFVMQKS